MRIPPKTAPEAKKDTLMLVLKPDIAELEQSAPLSFQKPGPPSEHQQAGLPPAPAPSPQKLTSPRPGEELGGERSATREPETDQPNADQGSLTLPIEPDRYPPPRVPKTAEKPFTSALESLEKGEQVGGRSGGVGQHGTGTGSGSSAPSLLSGDATFAFDSGGFDLSEWAELVKQKVRSNWVIPTAALLGMKGVVGIYLTVEKNGTISHVEIVSSSSIISLDSAALNAVRSSNPLPPLPPGFPKQNLQGRFGFYYNTYPPRD